MPPIPILVVSPQADFGELLRKGLDAARYRLLITADFAEAIHHVRKSNCPIALLDADLDDVELSVLDIGLALRQIKEDLQYIVVKGAGQETDTHLLSPAAAFTKPVPISTLNAQLTKMAQPTPAASLPAPKPLASPSAPALRTLAETARMIWIQDVSKAAQHLTRLTLESSAQAALITRDRELWAYAGQLSREAAQELAQSIQRYWDRENESDILHFIRLQSTEAQHVLYARKLSASMVLALVFDGETPFSTIRSQAGKLVKNLANAPGEEPAPAPHKTQPPAAIKSSFLAIDENEEEEDEDLPPIAELLGDVPPPNPVFQPYAETRTDSGLPWDKHTPTTRKPANEPKTEPPPLQEVPPTVIHFSKESSPPLRQEPSRRPLPALDETMAVSLKAASTDVQTEPPPAVKIPEELQMTHKQEQKDESLIETRPQFIAESVTQVAHRILLEPASPAMADLAYACLLVPRFDHHHLVGEAADRLTEWVPKVCIAFGWRLEYISVRPDYLQWVARVPPSTAPGYIMRIIRQQTSEKLFAEFPRFKKDNPSNDFWAPGYLIMGSSQPHPHNMVRNHIKQTRERQGIGQDE